MKLTHENFELILNAVKNGEAIIFIASNTKPLKIDKKVVAKFEKAGFNVISKDNDGKGFRVQVGRNCLYVIPGYAIAQAI